MEKRKVLIVNDLAEDVFSAHFLENEEISLSRLNFNQALMETSSYWRIILVNQKIALGVRLKEKFPETRIISVSGGHGDFEPYLTVVNGKHNIDQWSYASWSDFDRLIKSDAKQEKIFRPLPKSSNHFAVRPGKSSHRLGLMDSKSSKSIAEMSNISLAYLGWHQNWLATAKNVLFPFDGEKFSEERVVDGFSLELKNDHDSLPIFYEGDSVSFITNWHKKINFFDYKNKPVIASLEKVGEGKIYVRFSEPVLGRELRYARFIKPNLSMATKRNNVMMSSLKKYRSMLGESDFQAEFSRPALFLASSEKFPLLDGDVSYPRVIELYDYEQKIFRDRSQQKALLDMLSDRPITKIIGPAGTGKTFVAAIAARHYARQGYDVLLISHSNTAVDVLTSETKKFLDPSWIYRLGNEKKIALENQKLVKKLRRKGFDEGRVVACTIDSFFSLGKKFAENDFKPQVVIFDEASRGLFPEVLPFILAARKKIILIGDDKQLGGLPLPETVWKNMLLVPSVTEENLDSFADGFFNMLMKKSIFPSSMLRINRRSLPVISELVNKISYNGKLFPGRFNPNRKGEIILLDTSKMETQEVKQRKSWINKMEVNLLVRRFITEAAKHVAVGGNLLDCAIITPYAGQEDELRQALRRHLLFHSAFKNQVKLENIELILSKVVATVDSMQGGERKIILLSLVRSNDEHNIGFNSDLRRLNVSISRACNKLLIFGDLETFLRSENYEIAKSFALVKSHVKKHGVYVELS